jgi:hypothetical protein
MAADFPRGPPVRAAKLQDPGAPVRTAKLQDPGAPVRTAKRTNWLLGRGRASMSSTLTDKASSSRYRSFEPAVRGTGDRRRNSTIVGRGRDRRPISRVDRLFAPRNSKIPERPFAPRSGRTGFLNGDARRSPRRSPTKPVRLAIARSNRRSAAQVFDAGSRRGSAAPVLADGSRRGSTSQVFDDGSRRNSTGVGRRQERRPISRVDRPFAPRSGRTGFLDEDARRVRSSPR